MRATICYVNNARLHIAAAIFTVLISSTIFLSGCGRDMVASKSADSSDDRSKFELARSYTHGTRKDYARALALYNELCAQHSPLGLYGKAELFWSGAGVEQDQYEAYNLLERAAKVGLTDAKCRLAEICYYGDFFRTNKKEAAYWAEKASIDGDVFCRLLLAEMKMRKEGEESDCAGGLKELTALANQSIPEAQDQLGRAYQEGLCVPKDATVAKDWLKKAADRGYVPALIELSGQLAYGEKVPPGLKTAFDRLVENAKARELFITQRADGQRTAGDNYADKYSPLHNANQARMWYQRSAAGGNPHACNNLSVIYCDTEPYPRDLDMCLEEVGVQNGCWMACYSRGLAYQNGYNRFPIDIPKAITLFERSNELNHNDLATYELAQIYEKGLGGKKNQALAEKYYALAAKYGNVEAKKRKENMMAHKASHQGGKNE